MSGYAEEQLRQSINLDNVSFLPKPFSVQQIAEAVRNALKTLRQFIDLTKIKYRSTLVLLEQRRYIVLVPTRWGGHDAKEWNNGGKS